MWKLKVQKPPSTRREIILSCLGDVIRTFCFLMLLCFMPYYLLSEGRDKLFTSAQMGEIHNGIWWGWLTLAEVILLGPLVVAMSVKFIRKKLRMWPKASELQNRSDDL